MHSEKALPPNGQPRHLELAPRHDMSGIWSLAATKLCQRVSRNFIAILHSTGSRMVIGFRLKKRMDRKFVDSKLTNLCVEIEMHMYGVCVCVCIHISVHIHTHTRAHLQLRSYVCVCVYIPTSTYPPTHLHTYLATSAYIHTCLPAYVHAYMAIVHTCIYIQTDTHTHTRSFFRQGYGVGGLHTLSLSLSWA